MKRKDNSVRKGSNLVSKVVFGTLLTCMTFTGIKMVNGSTSNAGNFTDTPLNFSFIHYYDTTDNPTRSKTNASSVYVKCTSCTTSSKSFELKVYGTNSYKSNGTEDAFSLSGENCTWNATTKKAGGKKMIKSGYTYYVPSVVNEYGYKNAYLYAYSSEGKGTADGVWSPDNSKGVGL